MRVKQVETNHITKHGQNGRGERTRGGIVLLARERNFPKNSQ